jgi:hypothetical protein
MTVQDQLAEVEQRYGEGEIVDALRETTPFLMGAVERTQDWLRNAGGNLSQAMTA